METLLGQQDATRTEDAVTRRVVIEAKRAFESVADEDFIEQAAQHAVKELWRDSIRVTTFVPVLAMRRVRETVDQRRTHETGTVSIER
jgi:hypothetical protein